MRIDCPGIVDGWIQDRYGAKGGNGPNGMPGVSLPFSISGAPEGTACYAVVFDDYDAVSASGFLWVHWLICDLKQAEVAEGASGRGAPFTEGSNNWFSALGALDREGATGYGGPAPPNGMHRYTLKAYALDAELGLPRGFRLNDLYFAMKGHVLDHCEVVGKYTME